MKKNLEKMEKVKFTIAREALKPKVLTCSKCNVKMRKAEIDISLGDVFMKVSGFECPKCNKRYLGLEEAKKLDKAMIISRVLIQR